MRSTTLFGAGLAAALVAGSASASITGAVVVSYSVTAADFGGAEVTVNVQDLYMTSNDSADVMLNVYNLTLSGTASGITYFQSLVSTTGWTPNNAGSIFDTAALQQADSFVTMGGFGADALQVTGAGVGTGLDPNFGGPNAAAPGALGGWYNASPPSLNGQVINTAAGLGVLVGRFSYAGDFSLEGSTLEATWNQGLGTDGVQAAFTVTPAPGALALLGLAGVAGRRRRNG